MIHTVYTMTIGRYGQLDKTQDARLLRRWFNPLPVGLFSKQIERFFDQVREVMGDGEADSELTNGIERAYMVNKMLQLSILYDALSMLLVLQAQLDLILMLAEKEIPGKGNLNYYLEQVKEMTGIEIKDFQDLPKLQKELTRLSDKFKEQFPDEEVEEKSTFYRSALAIFSLMEMPYNPDMTLAEFSELKALASERQKQLKSQMDKYDGATG